MCTWARQMMFREHHQMCLLSLHHLRWVLWVKASRPAVKLTQRTLQSLISNVVIRMQQSSKLIQLVWHYKTSTAVPTRNSWPENQQNWTSSTSVSPIITSRGKNLILKLLFSCRKTMKRYKSSWRTLEKNVKIKMAVLLITMTCFWANFVESK